MQFSNFKEHDLSAIELIENEVHAYPWTRGNFLDSIKSSHTCLMMKLNQEIIGFSVMMFVLDECHLLNMSIKKSMQKKRLWVTFSKRNYSTGKVSSFENNLS